MKIHGFNKTTLLDYPKHLASTIFFGGCNFRCPFCHNASLVIDTSSQETISPEEILLTLEKRKGFLEGVCITGGEPTIHKDLPDFIKKIKVLGLKVKLDTNGTNPHMIKYLVTNNLIDYIAMDIKNSREKYGLSIGILDYDISPIEESVNFLLTKPIEFEFRTTIVKEHHNADDIIDIGKWIKGAPLYFLQSYEDSDDLISPGLSAHSKDVLLDFVQKLKPYVPNTSIRGLD